MAAARLAELQALLRAHAPADATEAGHLARMLELCAAGEEAALDPFARGCFAPGHFTASAFVLSPARTELLLILHARLGFWMQPGGHVDPEDRGVLAAALRELREETGLVDVAPWPPATAGLLDVDIHPIPARRDEPAHEHFDLRWLFASRSRDLRESAETRGIRWVPLDRVPGLRSDASVLRALQRTRALLAGA